MVTTLLGDARAFPKHQSRDCPRESGSPPGLEVALVIQYMQM
jgi:hypothetical protein